MSLDELRERLSAVDRELISLVAQRQEIVAEVSAYKLRTSTATRDYARERRSSRPPGVRRGRRDLTPKWLSRSCTRSYARR